MRMKSWRCAGLRRHRLARRVWRRRLRESGRDGRQSVRGPGPGGAAGPCAYGAAVRGAGRTSSASGGADCRSDLHPCRRRGSGAGQALRGEGRCRQACERLRPLATSAGADDAQPNLLLGDAALRIGLNSDPDEERSERGSPCPTRSPSGILLAARPAAAGRPPGSATKDACDCSGRRASRYGPSRRRSPRPPRPSAGTTMHAGRLPVEVPSFCACSARTVRATAAAEPRDGFFHSSEEIQ